MKLERLISIIFKLLNHEVLSASTLAEEFQVSPRTIYRDIDVICAAGFPVVSHQGLKGGYGIIDGYKMDKSLLGSYDVNSLITVLSSLSTVFDDGRVQGTIERLQTIGSEHQSPSLSIDLETRRTEPDALPYLRTGITEYRIIQFDYINTKNERTSRRIEPIRLHFKYRNWYVYGFCLARQDYREFRLSRMMNVSLSSDTFQPHTTRIEPIVESRIQSDTTLHSQTTEVVFKVNPEALSEAMDHFQQADKQFHNDGSMTMRIAVHQPLKARWLCSFLLSLGSGAEVLEPVELRNILREELQNALKPYQKTIEEV
ncbi:helix-turn-helix transcriptional regulator [Paenibacillus tundrae]|uniref:DNA-binding transcriptional regulator YafY n=1 Tax=Paenibacillus tundrae TaxID=528187 RepID=A0ABT9WED4_9BACL|nr:YafY family protein [Paenibacillus tundrae]MDQ0171639.1 putative DNA-binding transcriptional regulator YafY [Paenibacillus tundrae]